MDRKFDALLVDTRGLNASTVDNNSANTIKKTAIILSFYTKTEKEYQANFNMFPT